MDQHAGSLEKQTTTVAMGTGKERKEGREREKREGEGEEKRMIKKGGGSNTSTLCTNENKTIHIQS